MFAVTGALDQSSLRGRVLSSHSISIKMRFSTPAVLILGLSARVSFCQAQAQAQAQGFKRELVDTTPIEWITFKNNQNQQYCIELKEQPPQDLSKVGLGVCNGTPSQSWFIDDLGRIRSMVGQNYCIESGKDGEIEKMFVYNCHDGMWQRWTLQSDGRIRNQGLGSYIGVNDDDGCGGVNAVDYIELQVAHSGSCSSQQQWILSTPQPTPSPSTAPSPAPTPTPTPQPTAEPTSEPTTKVSQSTHFQ